MQPAASSRQATSLSLPQCYWTRSRAVSFLRDCRDIHISLTSVMKHTLHIAVGTPKRERHTHTHTDRHTHTHTHARVIPTWGDMFFDVHNHAQHEPTYTHVRHCDTARAGRMTDSSTVGTRLQSCRAYDRKQGFRVGLLSAGRQSILLYCRISCALQFSGGLVRDLLRAERS